VDPVRVSVIGSGTVGRALAAGFAAHGHEVTIGTREPAENDDLQAWAAQHDERHLHGSRRGRRDRRAGDKRDRGRGGD
jgi:predicted dinucleotide-binding enzyme